MSWTTEDMARRAAKEIPAGSIVNLGIGLPTQVADYLPEGHAWLHSENGLLGTGPFPFEGEEDPSLINAGKQTVTVLPGDVALVRATISDRFGNLRFWRTARNFNPVMATAAKLTIVEADHLVDNGAIDPDDVHLSGIFVHRIVHVPEHEDAFEYRTVRRRA